jgi:hypothetical protein
LLNTFIVATSIPNVILSSFNGPLLGLTGI